MFLDCRNVLSKNYKYQINYLRIMFIFNKKLHNFSIPYWVRRSYLSDEMIKFFKGLDKE